MIIGEDVILKLVKQEGLVTGLSDLELSKPSGAGFDLRLGAVYKLVPDGKTFVTDFDPDVERFIDLKARSQVYCETFEELELPGYILGLLSAKSNLFNIGLSVSVSNVPPGFRGRVKFLLVNNNPNPVRIQLGAPMLRISFLEVKSGVKQYKRPK